MGKIEKVEKPTKEQKTIIKNIKRYEGQAERDARKFNTFLENLRGSGIKKEDIIRLDAELEKGIKSDKLRNSTLLFREVTNCRYDGSNHFTTYFSMKGLIDNRKVKIRGITNEQDTENLPDGLKFIFGTINGRPISPSKAKKILLGYEVDAKIRTNEIDDLHESKMISSEETKE